MRECAYCGIDISHKRSDAKFCSKNHKAEHSKRSTGYYKKRYGREADERKAQARASYWLDPERNRQSSRDYRREHPERRRRQADLRAERMRLNPDYAPFGDVEWQRLVNRFNGACAYCGAVTELHKDHVVPLSRGGRHAIANILPACKSCNARKASMFISEWKIRGDYIASEVLQERTVT